MHILPLLILLLLSCADNKKKQNDDEFIPSPSAPPAAPPAYLPSPSGAARAPTETKSTPTISKTDDDISKQDDTQQKETGKHDEPEKQPESDKQVEPETDSEAQIDRAKPEEPEVLSIKLSFAVSDNVLYPLLEFSPQYVDEISDIELRHSGAVTLPLDSNAAEFEHKGIVIPPLQYWLKLKWRGKTCHERITVENMTQTTEVLCR